jgi:hypothetical protein
MHFETHSRPTVATHFDRFVRRGLPAVLGCLLLVAPGCGGSGGKKNTTPAPPKPDGAHLPPFFGYPNLTINKGGSLSIPGPQGPHWQGAVFTVAPPFPLGLFLNPATGAISGRPTQASPVGVYKVTATKAGQVSNASVTILVRDHGAAMADAGSSAAPGE